MKSHTYDFRRDELARLIGLPLIAVSVFAAAMHLAVALRLLPAPRPALDADRTILLHQADASRSPNESDLLLIGDSSCLMDVSAPQLSKLSGRGAFNLGTLSYLGLEDYATLLRHYGSANRDRLRAVVVLLHPESLRRVQSEPYYANVLNHFFAESDDCPPHEFYGSLACLLGLESLRGRLLSRLAPAPLSGDYGRFYGFTADLWRYLDEHRGSAIDPQRFTAQSGQGNAEYRLSRKIETASRAFREAVPKNVRLIIGITPVPESLVPSNYRELYQRMLRQWSDWMQAEVTLTDLPPVLPDRLFANTAHLNETGVKAYTKILADNLAAVVR